MGKHPRLVVAPVTQQGHLQSVVLHVDARRQHDHLIGDRGQGLPPLRQRPVVDRLPLVLPRLAEVGIGPHPEHLGALLRGHEVAHPIRQRRPWRIHAVDGEAGHPVEGFISPPLAISDRPNAVGVAPQGATSFAGIARGFRVFVDPLHIGPFQHLKLLAVAARDMIAALIRRLESLLDATGALVGGRAHHDDLTIPEGGGPLPRQLDRIALRSRARRIAVHLVAEHQPDRAGGEPRRTVRAHHGQGATGKDLVQRGVATIPSSRVFDLPAQGRRRAHEASGHPVFRKRLRHLKGRLQNQYRAGIVGNVEAEDVENRLGLAQLSSGHHHHLGGRRIGAGVHDAALVLGAGGVPAAGLATALRVEPSFAVGPLADA